MTKSSTVWAVAGGTVVTVCVAGGGLVGLTRALDPQPATTSTLTTSHGVMTKSKDSVPSKSATPHAPAAQAPPTGGTGTRAPLTASDPTIVPPAAPKVLDVPSRGSLKWAEGRWADHNGDAHRWMHQRARTDDDLRTGSGDPTPDSRMTPSPEAPATEAPTTMTQAPTLRMAPVQQQTDNRSHDQYRTPGPRHRADEHGDFGPRGTVGGHGGGHFGGHHDDGSHGRHR